MDVLRLWSGVRRFDDVDCTKRRATYGILKEHLTADTLLTILPIYARIA